MTVVTTQQYRCVLDTLPEFDSCGCLPPGIHPSSWLAFAQRFGGTDQRQRLLGGLAAALAKLAAAGCSAVYVDGSFVTTKAQPADFDACWDPTNVNFDRVLAVFWEFADSRRAQKQIFGGEFFPMDWPADVHESFLEFFQHDRDGLPKGIVQLDPGEVLP